MARVPGWRLSAQAAACAGLMMAMTACTGTKLQGRAITGTAGVIAVVPDDGAHDQRPGLEGTEVRVESAGGGIIGTATSDANGYFRLSAPTNQARGRVDVVAEREGYPRQRGTVTFPGRGHLLLVIFPDRPGASEGASGAGAGAGEGG